MTSILDTKPANAPAACACCACAPCHCVDCQCCGCDQDDRGGCGA